jgi:hypothetical protein
MHPTENKNIPNHLLAIILTLKGLKSAIKASIKKFIQVIFKIIVSPAIINKTEIYVKFKLYIAVKQKCPTQMSRAFLILFSKVSPTGED